ncbi:Crp/Fnr family transcriptional regulator [Marinifilum sp. D737]|uniref:Crp/Fnr family transcriptional regulator n=1 Tax=Marinifilum sp. D737 TaxID=2969628 RepID=UPI002276BE54|nr:Crp/Fnr family transcriptional regulator [Marinifilum sp. D737]MCY1633791.1 Crp/Fnr family transcriptional regulator [Marinifilum sp. D737]
MSLKKDFHDYLSRFVNLKEEEISAFYRKATIRKLKKREHFVKAGEHCSNVLFTNSGYLRFYHLSENGNEITSDFYFAPSFITSYTSFITKSQSLVSVQAMQDMEVLEFSREDIYKLYAKYSTVQTIGRMIAEQVAINSERHLFLLLGQSAETRYKELMEKYPQHIQSIPLQYIASYLGITKESLSRIRKSIH